MNIYLKELRINQRTFIIWLVILAALGVLEMAMFPTIAEQAEILESFMAGLPQGFLAAFGLETISMTEILGFYGTEWYMIFTLFGSMFAIILSSGILSKEESDRTIEFLLSKPVSRSEILTAKLLSFISIIIVFNLLISIIMYFTLELVKIEEYSIRTFILLSVAPLLLHITFASIGFFISVFLRSIKTVFPLSLGLVLLTYFLGIISSLTEKLDFIKYFSPFKYVDAVDIISTGGFEQNYLIIMALINVVVIGLTYILYNRKNIMV